MEFQGQEKHHKGILGRDSEWMCLGKVIFLSLSSEEKPNPCAVGEKFPAERFWQHPRARWKRDFREQSVTGSPGPTQGMFPCPAPLGTSFYVGGYSSISPICIKVNFFAAEACKYEKILSYLQKCVWVWIVEVNL